LGEQFGVIVLPDILSNADAEPYRERNVVMKEPEPVELWQWSEYY
jgi:hypothetical protein